MLLNLNIFLSSDKTNNQRFLIFIIVSLLVLKFFEEGEIRFPT